MYTVPAGGITLGDIVENLTMRLRRKGQLPKGVTVSDVTLNHPTEPTVVRVHFSNQTSAKIDIKRPTH
jgi:hypothetical protein